MSKKHVAATIQIAALLPSLANTILPSATFAQGGYVQQANPPWAFNQTQLNGVAISSACATTLSGLATSSVPSIVCQVFGAYVINSVNLGAASIATSSPVTPSNLAVGATNFTTSQTTISTTATQIFAARSGVASTGRVSLTVCNTTTVAVYLGGSSVTTTNGVYLAGVAGACATINTQAAVFGIVASGTTLVSEMETY